MNSSLIGSYVMLSSQSCPALQVAAAGRSRRFFLVLASLLLVLGGPAPALPNLRIESISVPSLAAVADAIPIEVVLTNAGDSPTTAGSSVGIGPTTGTTFEGEYFGMLEVGPGLAAGESVTLRNRIFTPLPPGTYKMFGRADAFEDEAESNEADNTLLSTGAFDLVTGTADLVVVSVEGPARASRGDTIPMTVTVANIGTGPARFSSSYFVSFSTDSRIDSDDPVLVFGRDVPPLNPGESFAESICCVRLPSDLSPGPGFLGVLADAFKHLGESDEANNASTAPASILIEDPTVDFRVEAVAAPASSRPGDGVSVQATLIVTGAADTAGPVEVRAHLARGRPATLDDPFIAATVLSGLRPPVTTQVALLGILPGELDPGEYTVTVITDPFELTGELDEANNTASAAAPLTVRAVDVDLTVSDLELPGTSFLGQPLRALVTVTNTGAGDTGVTFANGAFLSIDSAIDEGDVPLGLAHVDGLAAGASARIELGGVVPAALQTGTYTYGVMVDLFQEVGELDDGNNTITGGVRLATSPIELRALRVLTAPAGRPGETLPVFVELLNSGSEDSGRFHVGFLLTSNPSDPASLLDLYQVPEVEAGLSAGERRLAGPFFLGLPGDLQPLSYRVVARVDAYDEVGEADEENNFLTSAESVVVSTEATDDHPDTLQETTELRDALQPDGTPVSAAHERPGDIDCFQLPASAGDQLVAEAFQPGGSAPDTELALFSPDGTLLAESERREGLLLPRVGPLAAPSTGIYKLTVRRTDSFGRGAYSVRALAQSGTPDLIATISSPSPGSVPQGGRFRTTITVTNVGPADALSGSVVEAYLSTDTAITTRDLSLARFSLPDLAAAGGRTRRTVIPLVDAFQVPPGTYRLGLIVDAADRLRQSDRTNDATATASLTVLPVFDDHPGSAALTEPVRDGLVLEGPRVDGSLGIPGDEDFFRFPIQSEDEYVVEATDSTVGGVALAVFVGAEDNVIGESESSTEDRTARVALHSFGNGIGFARVRAVDPARTGSYSIRLARAATGTVDDYEDSVTGFHARVPLGQRQSGVIGSEGDADVVELRLQREVSYRIRVAPAGLRAVRVDLFGPGGTDLVASGLSERDSAAVELVLQPTVTGAYPLRVRARDAGERGAWELVWGFEPMPTLRVATTRDGDVLRTTVSIAGLPSPLEGLQAFLEHRADFLDFSGSVEAGAAAPGLAGSAVTEGEGATRVELLPRDPLSPSRPAVAGELFTVTHRITRPGVPLPPAASIVRRVVLETAFGDVFQLLGPDADAGLDVNVLVRFDGSDRLLPTLADPLETGGAARHAFVRLDGRLSTDPSPFPLPLTYRWFDLGGPVPTILSGDRTSVPTFVPTTVGTYFFGLVVENGLQSYLTDVQVTVGLADRSPAAQPVARDLASSNSTGPATPVLRVQSPEGEVELDGTGSFDPDAQPQSVLTYQWTQESGPEAALVPAGDVAKPRFTARLPGFYEFSLIVTDPDGLPSPPTRVAVQAIPADRALPVLSLRATSRSTSVVGAAEPEAGPDRPELSFRVTLPTVVALSAFIVDPAIPGPDDHQLRVRWSQVDGPRVALSVREELVDLVLFSRTAFSPTTARVHEFECRVAELDAGSAATGIEVARRIRVVVDSAVNQVPRADAAASVQGAAAKSPAAGAGQPTVTVPGGVTVTLDGLASRDTGPSAVARVAYTWVQTAGPQVELSSPFSAVTTFVTPSGTGDLSLLFSLFVDDGQARSVPAPLALQLSPQARSAHVSIFGPVELLAVPLSPSSRYDSSDLLRDTGAPALARLVSGPDGSRFETRLRAVGTAPFAVAGNQGYVLLMSRAGQELTFTGLPWPAEALSLQLLEGLNVIALPRGAPAGYSLDDLITVTGSPFVAYTDLQNGRSKMRIYLPGIGGAPPLVQAGKGYLLSVSSSRTVSLPQAP